MKHPLPTSRKSGCSCSTANRGETGVGSFKVSGWKRRTTNELLLIDLMDYLVRIAPEMGPTYKLDLERQLLINRLKGVLK